MRAIVGTVVVLALAAGLAGCGDDPPSLGVAEGSSVALLGDSILYQSAADVTAAFRDAGYEPLIEAKPGAAINGAPLIDWKAASKRLLAQHDPKAVIVELGTNGCGICSSTAEAIDAVLEPLRDVPQVVWIDARSDGRIPPDPDAINDALRDAEDRWDNLTVVDFDDLVGEQDIGSDRIHLNESGRQRFADALVDIVD